MTREEMIAQRLEEAKQQIKAQYPEMSDYNVNWWATRICGLGMLDGDDHFELELDKVEETREAKITLHFSYGS